MNYSEMFLPRGRPPVSTAVYIRDLTKEDLERAKTLPSQSTHTVQTLRHRHHMLAQLLASGQSQEDVSRITGYGPSYISRLAHEDPAFMELVSYYQRQKQEIYLDVHSRLAALGIATIEELQERINEKPKDFTNNELVGLMKEVLSAKNTPQATAQAAVAVNVTFVTPEGGQIIEHKE